MRGPRSGRIVGIDAARALALLGMMATHIWPEPARGVSVVQQVAGGRSSALFAVLAGVSLALVAGPGPVRGRPWAAMAAGTVVRAALVGALGLALGALDSRIAVILVYYAVLFVVSLPFLALGTRPLVATLVAWVLLAPVLSQLLRLHLPPPSYDVPQPGSLAAPLDLARELLLTGYYPTLTWVPFILAGLLLARLDLRRTDVALRLVLGGAAGMAASWAVPAMLLADPGRRAALSATLAPPLPRDLDLALATGSYGVTPTGSWWWLAVRAPHTGTTPDVVGTTASACLVLGLCLLVAAVVPSATRVVLGAGAMTLTAYSLHVVLRTDGWWDASTRTAYAGQAGLVLAIGAVFAWRGWRGPLELVVGRASAAARAAVLRGARAAPRAGRRAG